MSMLHSSTCSGLGLVLLLLLGQQTGAQHGSDVDRASTRYQHVHGGNAPLQASHGGTVPPVHVTNPLRARRRLAVASPAPSAVSCPSVYEEVTVSGCPCTVYHGDSGVGNSSGTSNLIRVNVCPAGLRCSHSAIESIKLAGWRRPSSEVAATPTLSPLVEKGICVPCQLGEFCPVGTQEDTHLSLSSCDVQAFSINKQSAEAARRKHPGDQNPLTNSALLSGSCSGVHLCPGGSYCPSPAERRPCEPGRWCPEGSIKSQPCNITGMLVWNPFRRAPGSTNLMLEALVKASSSLDGNSCPMSATNPLEGCPPGYFCPTAAQRLPCPAGHFCPGHTSAPVPCPVLGSCSSEKGIAPDWSSVGLLLMFLVLLVLLALLEYLRMSGRCRRKAQSQEDDVMQLIEAVGFKMVGTHGGYQVSRATASIVEQGDHRPHLRDVLQPAATALRGATIVRSGRQALSRAFRSVSGPWRHQHTQPHTAAKPAGTNHAVLTVEGVPATPKHRGWLAWRQNGSAPPALGEVPPAGGMGVQELAMKSPFEVATLPNMTGNASTAPSVLEVEGQAEADGEFVINPRLTLVFRDVWVADIPIAESLPHKAKRRVLGLWRKECPQASELNYIHSSPVDGSGSPCNSPQEEMYAKLEAAAASGAFFIVPGVSSRFPHSQLHAIMGPSGCGKTTLCKALAGRVPRNHMVGDVRVLCSSAADNYKAEVELTAAGTAGSATTACNISHMTGFVPQFDQLHETLTVLENLLLAAKLRLPVTGKGQGMAAAASRHMERQRHREVHKVVGEVMALMGLTKVATTVVGTSTQRLLSGGQRKRVAIAVELVSKPSLLWLDEPTSGLDAAVAYDVIAALKASSQRGMNVLAIMHQPRCSIFDMFDSCLLLGSNGNVVYSGPQRLAQSYMAFLGFYIPPNENLADFLLDVTAGVVPRPGDPDYIPGQLSAMWHKAGGIWLEQQLQKERQLHQHQHQGAGLQSVATLQISELLHVPAPSVAEPVDWPWRPRDLEALLARFNLIVDSGGRDATMFSGAGFRNDADASRAHGSSVLSYDGFLAFWDESGIKELLGQEEYALFIEGLCEDFDMKPDSCITQAHFVQVLKAQLRAAAAGGADMPAEHQQLLASVHGMPLHTIQQEQHQVSGSEGSADLPRVPAEAAAAGAAAKADNPLARKSAFAEYSSTPLEELDPCEAALQRCQAAMLSTEAALSKVEAADTASACEDADEEVFQAAAAACAAEAAHQAAIAQGPAAAAGTVPECRTPGQLSRTCSSATALSNADRACTPGMLTCPQARLRQHTLLRQRTLTRQASRLPEGMRSGPSARSGPSVAAECAQQLALQQQQCQQHMQALLRTRKARKAAAAAAAAAQPAGMRQVSQARLMHSSFSTARHGGQTQNPCASLQEARARCLDQLGDFLVMQESRNLGPQQQPLQQTWSDMCTVASMADALHRSGHGSYIVKLPPVPADDDAAAAGDAPPGLYAACTSPGSGGVAEAAAAAAAVRARKLPSVAKQLQTVMLRSSWKEVHSRVALMTDLLLTSVLGLALGIAQGRNIQPGSSLLWMLITLLAYGCITLVRSTRSYGSERHIYLQQESPAGVSVTAWVFGHQLIDLIGLMLHPMLFFAWMYVLTLTPVPAWSYFTTLAVVGFYTSGLGYLVSLLVHPNNAMIAGLGVALLLGGVANGVAPNLWQLESTHPLLWLDFLSYTRWGLQALYISWLIPAEGAQAPATATFLSGLGFCGLEPGLMQALSARQTSWDAEASKGTMFNATAISGQQWWNMTSVQRADALASAAADNLQASPAESRAEAAAAAAITQLWQYYNRPYLLDSDCRAAQGTAAAVLVGLGLVWRVLVFALVKWKVARKAQQ